MAHDFLLILWLGCTQKRDGIQLFARGVMLELSVFFDNSQIIVHLLRNIKFWIRPLENYRIIIIFNHLFNYMIIYIYISLIASAVDCDRGGIPIASSADCNHIGFSSQFRHEFMIALTLARFLHVDVGPASER